ncbi:MAG: ABC transporter substrate-binding protein [bacterium]
MKKAMIAAALVCLLVVPCRVGAGVPLETIRTHVNSVLEVLRDPALQEETARDTKKKRVESIADGMFDFIELAKRTLGREWNSLNRDQREEFVTLYRSILEKAYMDRILAYSDEKVVFDREIMLADDKAEVQSHILTASADIPIFYRVIRIEETWRVYDVIIEGVSLIKNYRTQFREILLTKSPDGLLAILREKVNGS